MNKCVKFILLILIIGAPMLSFAGESGPVNVPCSTIETVSYSGNGSNGTFQAMLRIKEGVTFHKNFLPPNGLQQASIFVKGLRKCDSLDLFYQRKSSSKMLMITTFAVNFKNNSED